MSRTSLHLPLVLKEEAEQLAGTQGVSLNQFIVWAVAEKVGSLKQRLDDPRFPRIAYRVGAAGRPEPVLRGTGIRVQTFVVAAQDWKMSPAQIAEEYGVTKAQVEEALSFYQTHRGEIEALLADEQHIEASASRA
jgi:uncharacterized protein (DUF433 family)